MTTIYEEQLRSLSEALAQYRDRRLTIDEIKARVWTTAQEVTSYEDRELRKFLQSAEGKLDMIQFTTDTENIFPASLEIVDAIEERIRTELPQS